MNPTAVCSPTSTPSSPRLHSSHSSPQTTAIAASTTAGGFYMKSPSYPSTPAPHYRTSIHSSHFPPQTPPPGYTHPPPPPSHSHPSLSNRQQGQRHGHSRSNSNSSIYHSYQYQHNQSHPYPFPSTSMVDPVSPGGLTGLGFDSANPDRQVVHLDRLDVSELSRALRRARAVMGYQQLDGDEEDIEEGVEGEREESLPSYRSRGRGVYGSSRSTLLTSFSTGLPHPLPSSSFPSDSTYRPNPNHISSTSFQSGPSRRVSCLPSAQTGPFFTEGTSPILCPLEDAHRSGEIDLGDGDRDAEEDDVRVSGSWVIWGLGVGLGIGSIGWAYVSHG
ncbi:hypothetical protein [Phaffia rhodozyma]|uniref:Uncharacterized protein n=1 Tax=Phaffia rhodozyma TaxID=264483 RepID=A0A0F7SFB4_PHARH|nr:hypothetical protein [Phaffia rhodozyma]